MHFHKKVVIKLSENENTFPVEILNNTDITELEIIGGNFSYISPFISQLKFLEKLSIVSTKISNFPKEIFELPNLNYLSLKNNRIVNIPKLELQSNIEVLILNKNYISDLSFLENNFSKLEYLDLGNNHIINFPETIQCQLKLRRINLEGNKHKLTKDNFRKFPELIFLNLDK